MPRPDPADLAVFEAQRPRLLRLAYRMLGSTAEAEDAVQEAWLRWAAADRAAVQTPAAYLTRTVTRLCLDQMKSARARRETYVGNWLPEPIFADDAQEAMPLDELTLTLMLALERLSPLERAAFLLHDVFGQPAAEVAATLDRDAAAVRQLAARARKHVRASGPRYPVDRTEGDRIARAFFAASSTGDTATLRALLADDVVLRADGGGKANAWLRPIVGLERFVRLYAALHRKLTTVPAQMIQWLWIDGLPGYVSRERDGALQTTALQIENGRVTAVYITRNPDKLNAAAVLEATRH